MAFKTLRAESLLRRVSASSVNKYATASEAVQLQEEVPVHFRTVENNPVNHTAQHKGRFYTIPNEIYKKLFTHGGIAGHFQKQVKTFNECSILVREPALEIISHMQSTDYSKPANRYLLYGQLGCGKTLTLAHILHYGFAAQRMIVHAPWVPNWFRRPKEVANSTTREGFFDLPIDSAAWLVHFKSQNSQLLTHLDLQLGKDYVWSKRETSKRGSSVIEMIDLGINRLKYASEVIVALISELKEASTSGKCNTLVVIDGYNSFFTENTRIFSDNKVMILPEKVSLTTAFLDITKYDWCNGSIVVAVDALATKEKRESDLPRYQLGKEGFEHMDPFVPISVDPYTDAEYQNVMDYYKDRRWVRDIDENGLQELKLLSAGNGYKLMNLCAPL